MMSFGVVSLVFILVVTVYATPDVSVPGQSVLRQVAPCPCTCREDIELAFGECRRLPGSACQVESCSDADDLFGFRCCDATVFSPTPTPSPLTNFPCPCVCRTGPRQVRKAVFECIGPCEIMTCPRRGRLSGTQCCNPVTPTDTPAPSPRPDVMGPCPCKCRTGPRAVIAGTNECNELTTPARCQPLPCFRREGVPGFQCCDPLV